MIRYSETLQTKSKSWASIRDNINIYDIENMGAIKNQNNKTQKYLLET